MSTVTTARRTTRRGRITLPDLGVGQQATHESMVSARALREFDRADETRAQRARDVLGNTGYEGTLTSGMLGELQELLDEPINPRNVVTTRGHEMTVTGIKSVQVQVDRLREVLGPTHYRLLPVHSPNGQLCRLHAVIGNGLQWCRVDERGELVPYTLVGAVAREASILAQSDGWGGHSGGFMPGDSRKGAETNAAKRVIARLGPGHELFRLEFEDNPNAAQAPTPTDVEASPAPERDGEALAEITRLWLEARTQGVTDQKVKAMLVAAGVIDTGDVLTAIAGLTDEQAAQFEMSLHGAIEESP